MLNSIFLKPPLWLIIVMVLIGIAHTALSEDNNETDSPPRYGLAAVLSNSFDPVNDIYFIQLSGFIMWDYDTI